MDSDKKVDRLPKSAFLASSIALFVLALLLTIARTSLRTYYYRRLFLDDGFLLFAALLACVCIGLYINFVDSMYLLQASIEDQAPNVPTSEIKTATLRFHLLGNVFIGLSWTVVIAVKYSFLFFFKMLIRRVRAMEMYWRCIAILTTVTWVAGWVGTFASCPYFDDRALSCVSGKSLMTVTTVVFYTILVFLDVATDLAIIAIPIWMLHKVQIRRRTKIILGASLCLSAVIITTAITQVAGFRIPGQHTVDLVWDLYWQWMEACTAIIVVCLAAFRSFFVQHMNRTQSSSTGGRRWYSGGVRAAWSNHRLSFRKQYVQARESPQLPEEAAVLPRTRTVIEGNNRGNFSAQVIADREAQETAEITEMKSIRQLPCKGQSITVQHEFSTHWERIASPDPSP